MRLIDEFNPPGIVLGKIVLCPIFVLAEKLLDETDAGSQSTAQQSKVHLLILPRLEFVYLLSPILDHPIFHREGHLPSRSGFPPVRRS